MAPNSPLSLVNDSEIASAPSGGVTSVHGPNVPTSSPPAAP
jgi:hypothetical protein